jgi:hypothetical protein
MERLGLSDEEFCEMFGVDPLDVVSGGLEDRPEVAILHDLTAEAAEVLGPVVMARWVRTPGPSGRPLDHLLKRDFPAFEDALGTLMERGFVVRGRGRN